MLRPSRVLFDRFRFFVAKGDSYRYIAWGIPGFMHIGLMNERGLCFVGNAVGMSDGGLGGNTIYEIIGSALTSCSTVQEVVELYRHTRRLVLPGYTAAILANLNSMWTDTGGNAITIEYSKKHIEIRHVGMSGVMVETNHHQYLNRNLSGGTNPNRQKSIAGSYARLGRAWELAKKYSGKFDLKTMIHFASDHGINYSLLSGYDYEISENGFVDDSTICCHLWNFPLYLRNLQLRKTLEVVMQGETLYSFILQPKRKLIWFCRGKPCTSSYTPLDFSKALKKSKPVKQPPIGNSTKKLLLYALRIAERALPVE